MPPLNSWYTHSIFSGPYLDNAKPRLFRRWLSPLLHKIYTCICIYIHICTYLYIHLPRPAVPPHPISLYVPFALSGPYLGMLNHDSAVGGSRLSYESVSIYTYIYVHTYIYLAPICLSWVPLPLHVPFYISSTPICSTTTRPSVALAWCTEIYTYIHTYMSQIYMNLAPIFLSPYICRPLSRHAQPRFVGRWLPPLLHKYIHICMYASL